MAVLDSENKTLKFYESSNNKKMQMNLFLAQDVVFSLSCGFNWPPSLLRVVIVFVPDLYFLNPIYKRGCVIITSRLVVWCTRKVLTERHLTSITYWLCKMPQAITGLWWNRMLLTLNLSTCSTFKNLSFHRKRIFLRGFWICFHSQSQLILLH